MAGLLEGDGYFALEKSGRIGVRCELIDRDTIESLANLFGSRVYMREGRGGNRQATFFTEPRNSKARRFLDELYPLMGERRKKRIGSLVSAFGSKAYSPLVVKGEAGRNCDIAWVAGLLEAEGSFSGPAESCNTLKVHCTMTDKDVIDRLSSLMGGRVISLSSLPSGKVPFRWHTTNSPDALRCMEEVLPHMHNRRTQRIEACLNEFKERRSIQISKKNSEFEALVRLYQEGLTLREIGGLLDRKQSFVVKNVKKARELGLVERRYS